MVYKHLANLFHGTRGMQYVTVVIVSLVATSTQSNATWASPTIPKLTGDDSPFGKPISDAEASWVVSVNVLASIPVALTYHLISARFSQKQMLFAASITLCLPWFLVIFGNHIAYIYAAKVLSGIFVIVANNTAAIYCADVSDSDIRGRLGTIYGMMKILGSILVLAVGPFVSYHVLAILLTIIPFSLFCLLFFVPESPYSLVKMNRLEDAKEAVGMLSGSTDEVEIDERIKAIVAFVNTADKPLSLREVFSNRRYARAIAIVISIITLECFGGYHAIFAYQQKIIGNSQSAISPEISSILFGVIQIPAAILSALLVDRLGRKIILYIGLTGCIIALTVEGVYFYLMDYMQSDVSSISWIPTTGIAVFMLMHSVHSAVPHILLGEFFTDEIKTVATTFCGSSAAIAVFVTNKTYEPIKNAFGLYTVMWIYAGFGLATILTAYFFLIETKNKTFQEIKRKVYK